MQLTMERYLFAMLLSKGEERGGFAALVATGFDEKVVIAKAAKASRRGYLEYGVSERYGWVTPKGVAYLEAV